MAALQDRTAIITGAARGIGKAVAGRFAREGAKVCLLDRDGETLQATAQELEAEGHDVLAIAADVTQEKEVTAAVDQVLHQWGRLDILVNNAGVIRDNLLFKMSEADWETVMAVHLKGAFLFSRAARQPMVAQQYGRIINLSSTSALGNRGQTNYAAAKAGMQGFTKTLAIELGKYGITCNAVAPGFIDTEMTRATAARVGLDFEAMCAEWAKAIPAGRVGRPEDVAAACLFFAREDAGYVNGQVLYAAGGPKD